MNWYVLYALSNKLDKLLIYLNRKQELEAFVPLLEYYRRKENRIDVKPLFNSYIFVKTNLDQLAFNDLLNHLEDRNGLIRQLWFKDETSALTNNEIKMFENILDGSHIVRMSQAFLLDGKAKIIDGPLKYYENNIIKVDKSNKLAYLNLSFMNRRIKAGLIITSKDND